MSDEILSAACRHLGIDEAMVMAHKVYEDHIALVVNRGGAGCPKYKIPFQELAEHMAKMEEEPKPEKPKRLRGRRAK